MAIPYYRTREANQVVKDQPLQKGNMMMKPQPKPLTRDDSDNEEACELSFEMIVKSKPSPNKVREFLQACVDQMNGEDEDDETDDYE